MEGRPVVYLFCFFSFLIGTACGYGVRAFVSYRRRAVARKEREWAKGRMVRLAEKENNPSSSGTVAKADRESNPNGNSNVVRLAPEDNNPSPTGRANG
jgi:hypothetical protein